jgi:hypothetical protein
VLGKVREKYVRLDTSHESDFEEFELVNHRLSRAGVGVTTIWWRWQFRISPNDEWTDFAMTTHRIYTLLQVPTCPWQQEPYSESNIQLPWTSVLEHACRWAKSATDDSSAAKRITQRTYELGLRLVTDGGVASYAHSTFNCTDFLELLENGVGSAQTLNCDDTASIVSTFSNAVGCDLWQSGMGLGFDTNRIRLIGSTSFATTGFARHAVAWRDECKENDELFDAFFQVDVDGKPLSGPEAPFLPTDMRFGQQGEEQYKFCLVHENSICLPRPALERKRRPLGSNGFLGDENTIDADLLDFIKKRYAFEEWQAEPNENPTSDATVSLENICQQMVIVRGWEFHSGRERKDPRFKLIIEALFQPSKQSRQTFFGLTLYQCAPTTNAREFLLQVLSGFQFLDLQTPSVGLFLGQVAFVKSDETAALFVRDKIVTLLRNAGRERVPVLGEARLFDTFLLGL